MEKQTRQKKHVLQRLEDHRRKLEHVDGIKIEG